MNFFNVNEFDISKYKSKYKKHYEIVFLFKDIPDSSIMIQIMNKTLNKSLFNVIIINYIILDVVKRNPLFFHSISCKNNGFLFTTPNIIMKEIIPCHERVASFTRRKMLM